MKAKIAKQEGEVRSAKKLNDQLNKHIRMLELALTNERNKNKATSTSGDKGKGEDKKDVKAKTGAQAESKNVAHSKHHTSQELDPELAELVGDRDDMREKSKNYLTKCVEEITYLLTPPTQPPPSQPGVHGLNGSGFINHDDPRLEEMYMQQHRQKLSTQLPTAPNMAMPNHQPPSIPTATGSHNAAPQTQQHHQAPQMQRDSFGQSAQPIAIFPELLEQGSLNSQLGPSAAREQRLEQPEEQVARITHTFDEHGRPVPNKEEVNRPVGPELTGDADWNFDEPPNEMPQEPVAPRRPDTDLFPSANSIPAKSPPRALHSRRKSSDAKSRRRSEGHESRDLTLGQNARSDPQSFKVRFALRGHLDVVRSVIFTGGGSPSEPEICTAGDDGLIKRWIIPASYAQQHSMNNDLDITPYWSHRGHEGVVTSLAACPASASFSTGGRVSGDGWIFSGGQDATVRVWERGRVDPKATLEGHTDAVWAVCVLPTTCGNIFGNDSNHYGGSDQILLASGSADGTIKIWAVSAPPQIISPQTGSRRGVGGSRRHSVTSGSNYPSSPQPSVATKTPFHYMLVHTIERATHASPTCISPRAPTGENFVVSFNDATILIYDTRTGEEIIGMASNETYDGTPAHGVNSVVATSLGAEAAMMLDSGRGISDEDGVVHGPTGSSSEGGLEGLIISGHEDQFIRFYDANSGQCTYSMLAHPSAISSLSLSKDGREAVSAGHDASIRFWSLDKRICTQEITAHRIMRGEGVCSVVWSQDGRLVVSAGGDGVVKVFAR
jgi:striatin 1/3/4